MFILKIVYLNKDEFYIGPYKTRNLANAAKEKIFKEEKEIYYIDAIELIKDLKELI